MEFPDNLNKPKELTEFMNVIADEAMKDIEKIIEDIPDTIKNNFFKKEQIEAVRAFTIATVFKSGMNNDINKAKELLILLYLKGFWDGQNSLKTKFDKEIWELKEEQRNS